MKKILLLTTLLFVCISVGAQTKVFDNLKVTYERVYLFNKIEVSPNETVAYVTFQHYPNYWILLNSKAYLQDPDSNKKYKLLRSEGFPLDKKQFMPESGKMDVKLFFEPIDKTVTSLDFIESDDKMGNTYGIALTNNETAFPSEFYGNWITTNGTNHWVYGIKNNVLIMENDVWEYADVKKRSNTYEITVKKDNKQEKLFAKLSKNGNLLVSRSNSKSFVEYGRNFVENHSAKSDWVFAPEKYRDSIYKKGNIVIRGYIDGYTPKLGFAVGDCGYQNYYNGESETMTFDIQSNGAFEFEMEIEHPMNAMSMKLSSNLFVIPNDTLFIYTNLKEMNNYMRKDDTRLFMSKGLSAEANNLMPVVEKAFNIVKSRERVLIREGIKSAEDVMKSHNLFVNDLKEIQNTAGDVLAKYTTSEFTKDILMTNLLTAIFTNLLDLQSEYDRTKMSYTQNSDGSFSIGYNPSYKKIPDAYFDFTTSIFQSVIDNPLIIASNSTWIPFNRFEFSPLAHPSTALKTKRTKIVQATIEKLIKENLITLTDSLQTMIDHFVDIYPMYSNPSPQFTKFIEVYNANFTDSEIIVSPKEKYAEQYRMMKNYGLDKCVLFDYALSKSCFNLLKNSNSEYALGEVSEALTYIKTPYIAGKIVQMYANKVRPPAVKSSSNPKSDTVFAKLIEPYKGNVLVIDFWNIGCGPCRSGMINARETVERYKENKIKFLYVTNEMASPLEATTKFLTENNIQGEQIRLTSDEWDYISEKFNISSVPRMILVDKNGNIVDDKLLEIKKEQLEELSNR